MDGLAVARAIRQLEAGHLLHLVAVTGYGRKEDRALTAQAGFDAHLVKPVDIPALEEMLRDYCAQSHARRVLDPVQRFGSD